MFIGLAIFVIIFLIFISAIISVSETSITSISVAKLESYLKRHKKLKKISKILISLLNNYVRTLMTILIFDTLINVLITSLMTFYLLTILNGLKNGEIATISTFLSAFLILVFGEIIPKLNAKKHAESYFVVTSVFIYFLSIIAYPLLWWTRYLKNENFKDHITENELLEIINIISDDGILEVKEHDLVKSAITFDDKKIKHIFKHRQDVKFLYHDSTAEEIFAFIKKYKYSRIPIIHRISGKVSGIIYIKDLVQDLILKKDINLKKLIRQPLFMYLNTSLDEALKIIQERQNHLIIIISNDTNNKFLGMITLEDIVEQIIGKIYDEYDKPGKIKEIGHSEWIVSGDVKVYNFFNKYLKISNNIINKNLTLTEWFILKNKKNIKNISELKSKKTIYKDYSFKINLIQEDNVYFKIHLLKIKK